MLDFKTLQKNKKLYKDEMVLCVPADEQMEQGYIEFKGKNPNYIPDTLGKYIERYKVEGDVSLYQLVPYLVVVNTDGNILTHISKKDKRITLGYSCHITPEIGGFHSIATRACMYLAMYNLGEFGVSVPSILDGYIKTFTDSTKGHLGMVYVLHIGDLEVQEDENFTYEFMSPEKLFEEYYNKMEEWAKLVLARFYKK